MRVLSYEEFQETKTYQEFIKLNPSVGHLKVQVFTAYQAINIPGTEILLTKDFGEDKVVFFRGYTDSSGIVDNIPLPAPAGDYDPVNFQVPGYTIYNLTAIHEGFEAIKKYEISMFGDIKILQYIKMIPEVTLEEGDTGGN